MPFLLSFRYVGMTRVLLARDPHFNLVFGLLVGLVNSCSSEISEEYGSRRSCLATLSLDTVEDVMDGEVDELEEDLG